MTSKQANSLFTAVAKASRNSYKVIKQYNLLPLHDMYMYMYLSKTSQPAALHHLETAFDFYKDSRVKKSYDTW